MELIVGVKIGVDCCIEFIRILDMGGNVRLDYVRRSDAVRSSSDTAVSPTGCDVCFRISGYKQEIIRVGGPSETLRTQILTWPND